MESRSYRISVLTTAIALAITLIACSGGEPDPQSRPEDNGTAALEEIADQLAAMAEAERFSGAVAIAREDEPVYVEAFGMANRSDGIRNDPDTRFNVASVGKTFTAVAVMQLVQRGLLDLHDPIGEYLPDLAPRVGERVTVHHLLSHTSGLHDFFADPRYHRLAPSLTSVSSYLPIVKRDRPEFEPGSRFQYSNSGYILLGLIIEEVSGAGFYDYLEDEVFGPAGMSNTGYPLHGELSDRHAVGYTGEGGRLRPNQRTLPARGSPAGGAYSTVGDLLRFAEALFGHALLDARHTRLLTTVKVRGPEGAYGYGFGLRGEPPTVGHNGGAPGVGAELAINPKLGYTAVVLSNRNYPTIVPVVDLILNALRIP